MNTELINMLKKKQRKTKKEWVILIDNALANGIKMEEEVLSKEFNITPGTVKKILDMYIKFKVNEYEIIGQK